MRNSCIHSGPYGPDTSELDAGWDLEPSSQVAATKALDSLRPSYASLPPGGAAPRARDVPSTRRRLLVAALIFSASFAVGVVVTFARGRLEPKLAPTPSAVAGTARAEPPPRVEAAAASQVALEATPAQPVEARRVLLKVDPPGARVSVRGQRIGSDLALELDERKSERATVTLPGYRTRVVEIDGSLDVVEIRLDASPRMRRAPKPRPAVSAEVEQGPAVSAEVEQGPVVVAEPRSQPDAGVDANRPSEAESVYPE